MAQTVPVISRLNPNDQPFFGQCTLVLLDGTVKVDFKNGRAEVPAEHAHLLAGDERLDLIGFDAPKRTAPKSKPTAAPAAAPAPAAESEAELDPAVAAAIEHLKAEGEDIPDIEPAADTHPGFEATTVDGQPRCQAPKGDGSQCSNASVDGSDRCNLPKHRA